MTSDTSASLQFLDPFSGPGDRGPLPPDASFIGAWDLDVGIDTLHEALFLFRSERQDLLWAFTSWSAEATGQYLARRETGDPDWASKTISCGCVAGLPRRGSASDSATRLTRARSLAAFTMSFPDRPGRRDCSAPRSCNKSFAKSKTSWLATGRRPRIGSAGARLLSFDLRGN